MRGVQRRVGAEPGVIAGAAMLCVVAGASVLAPWLAPYSPNFIDFPHRLVAPTGAHLLGADELGRDTLSRLLYGGRVSLSVSLLSVIVALVVGAGSGGVAGVFTGWVESCVMRVADIILTFPAILLALVTIAVLGTSEANVVAAIALAYAPTFTRVTWSSLLSTREQGYVEAARALGVGEIRLLVRHILPSIRSVLVVQASLSLAGAILVESTLGFLGLGVQPPQASWGAMIASGQLYIQQSIFVTLFPGMAIIITILAFSFLGDGLSDVLDPRLRMR